ESAGQRARQAGLLVSPVEVRLPDSVGQSWAEVQAFSTLPKTDMISLLRDRVSQRKRRTLIDPYWPLQRHEVHEPLALARARVTRVLTLEEYIKAISKAELMAILNSSQDLESISFRFAVAGRVAGDVSAYERLMSSERAGGRTTTS
ncbi:MAG TPA: glucans biosynthesis glucosyltransferase MdoH, partial [Hyphomonas sp.]|nr:glucans biosynthesis glucosyltransferase MdoH [Hyphomonas sp.]